MRHKEISSLEPNNLTHDQLDLQNLVYVDLPEKSEGMRTLVQKARPTYKAISRCKRNKN